MCLTSLQFQRLLLRWFDQHGRKNLPWQLNKTPYRIWVSEIMLQQTQVTTVVPYFQRFMQRFPDLTTLAYAKEDEVMHLWAGLGYYSRARNLHRAAILVTQQFGGQFPDTLDDLQKLPGIGASTAGAILSIAFNQPATILDGNVKRVLARFFGVTDPIDEKQGENKLWEIAKKLTPVKRTADYTQAMMDLGATCCTRLHPNCKDCVLAKHCVAYQHDIVDTLPRKKTQRKLPVRSVTFLVLTNKQQVLLQKRPPIGIWGSLWSFPEITGLPEKKTLRRYCQKHLKTTISAYATLEAFRHSFTHFHLDISPVVMTVKEASKKVGDDYLWYDLLSPTKIGLPKPVQVILKQLFDNV